MLGTRVGNYRITAVIGAGGMGAVYRAVHEALGRPVAVKLLLPEISSSRDMVTRFFNEARSAASIKHPGIVETHDVGFLPDGRAYIIMELLEGESLAGRLRRSHRMPCSQVLHIARSVESDAAPVPPPPVDEAFETPAIDAPAIDASAIDASAIDAPANKAPANKAPANKAPVRTPSPRPPLPTPPEVTLTCTKNSFSSVLNAQRPDEVTVQAALARLKKCQKVLPATVYAELQQQLISKL